MSVDVHDGDEFGEGDERETHRAVLVKEREPVFACARREYQADAEAEGTRDPWKKVWIYSGEYM